MRRIRHRICQLLYLGTLCCLLAAANMALAQALLQAGPITMSFRAMADSFDLPPPQMLSVSRIYEGEPLPFKLWDYSAGEGTNFLVVSPSSGVTPALLWVGLDRNVVPYLRSGAHAMSLRFGVPGTSCAPCAGTVVSVLLASRSPTITSVVNAATLQAPISPGAVVSILGTGLGTPPITARYDTAGLFPTSLGNSTVTFNGTPAPLLYVSTTRIDAVAPYGLAGQRTANIMVTHNLLPSPTVSVPVMDTSPGIFTTAETGTGHVILNANSTPNSEENPAPKGSAIQMWATGTGVWNRGLQDGSILLSALFNIRQSGYVFLRPAAPVSLTIGGQLAQILYLGPAPYEVSGKLQINAVIPEGIGSGPQPVVLKVGENDNSQQNVTIAVQ